MTDSPPIPTTRSAERSPAREIAALLGDVDRDPRSGDVLWRIRSDDGALDVTHGDRTRPFLLASATKLYVTALLAQLRTEGRLDWDQPLMTALPDLDLDGVISPSASVRDVMRHRAGLADYFEGRPGGGLSVRRELEIGDQSWDLDDVLRRTRDIRSPRRGRARYSDTGYQLLGALVERITGTSFAEAVHARIAGPIGLADTYCFGHDTLERFVDIAPLRHGDRRLVIPRALASMGADGGVVSTLDDSVAFLDAFFDGTLFDAAMLQEIAADWRRIMFPLEYGCGVMRYRPVRPLGRGPRLEFLGHTGATGTVLFRMPAHRLTIVGTVNQASHRSLPYRLLVRTSRLATTATAHRREAAPREARVRPR